MKEWGLLLTVLTRDALDGVKMALVLANFLAGLPQGVCLALWWHSRKGGHQPDTRQSGFCTPARFCVSQERECRQLQAKKTTAGLQVCEFKLPLNLVGS